MQMLAYSNIGRIMDLYRGAMMFGFGFFASEDILLGLGKKGQILS